MTCVISSIALLYLHYLSIVKREYTLALCLTVFISIFIIIPMMWIYNGGTFGSIPLYIVLFSSLGAALFSGLKRVAVIILLIATTNVLLVLEYKYPSFITAYTNDIARYVDTSIGLTTSIVVNTLFYVIILNYYNKEQEKVGYYLAQIEQQKKDIEFQDHLKMINQKLQQEIGEREDIEKILIDRNQQLQHEITERIRAERKADKQKRQLETIFQNSPDIIVSYDKDARHTFISSSAVRFGLDQQELIGKDATQIGHSEQCAKVWNQQFNCVWSTGQSTGFEMELLLNGRNKFFHSQLVPELDEHGETISMLGFFRDITTLKHTEKEMVRLDRLNLIGQMAASIGHEVRNPMTTVRGFLQYFGLKSNFSTYADEFNIMINELDRANGIITEFLSLAQTRTISLTQSSLNHSIKAIYPLLKATALEKGHNIELELGVVDDLLLDEKDIRQLILNLIHNGFEAIMGSGTVRIKTYQEGNIVILAVQDNGCGISQEVLSQLGTPFVTTKEKGTGLGLPVCYRIAERHNAKLEVETSSKGTIFSISFNISQSA